MLLSKMVAVGRVLAGTLLALAAVTMFSSRPTVRAQTQRGFQPYSMILTADRALAFVDAATRKLSYLPGEVIVRFRDGITVEGQQRALDGLRSRPAVAQLRWIDAQTAVLKDATEPNAELLADRLRTQQEVAVAEPNYIYRTNSEPNDPSFSTRQWNFSALDLSKAWDINPGANADLIVAVLDTGITTASQTFVLTTWDGSNNRDFEVRFGVNPDLASSRLAAPMDFAFWDGPVVDMVGHGTHVGSTIGEDTNNGLAEAGVAYKVKIMPVKVCIGYWEIRFALSASGYRGVVPPDVGGCSDDAISQGIRYAVDHGAKVLNMSLGGPAGSVILQDALSYAVGKGAFAAIAMGNEFEEGNPVEYPAAYAATIDGVMSVGAVGRSLTRAYYSSTGSHIEIAAPGGNFRDGGAGGLIWQASICPGDFDPTTVIFARFDRYCEVAAQGTSMASPHIAGSAALVMAQGVTNPAAIEALLKKTARDLGPPGKDDEFGFGLVQPRAALFGFGITR